MTFNGVTFAASLIGAVLLDGLARPRPAGTFLPLGRSLAGSWLLLWLTATVFGLFLACCGNLPVSAALTLALLALLTLASNAKHAMLGEPLLFSDLALVGAIFRHPQFYLSALKAWQRVAVVGVAAVLLAVVAWLFVPAVPPHLWGIALLLLGLGMLAFSISRSPFRHLARNPDAIGDVERHGLLPTLLLYWLRWRDHRDPAPCEAVVRAPWPGTAPPAELVVIIQCESFADPVELFGEDGLALPGLSFARANAWQWGQLEVSGFGAYTMRTEYGVLFGRSEAALGFRRYDPLLTALGESSYALPARLEPSGWRSIFVHPHDLRFYGRDRIMPAAGFAELVGEDSFAPVAAGEGRYVTDAAVADQIVSLARAAPNRTMIYAVTIENHGPWAPEAGSGSGALLQSYLRLVRRSDAMLSTLLSQLAALERPALLVFFGDHRPSIPGVTAPGGARHTPYVVMRLDGDGSLIRDGNRRADLTPADLHHVVLDTLLGAPSAELSTPPAA